MVINLEASSFSQAVESLSKTSAKSLAERVLTVYEISSNTRAINSKKPNQFLLNNSIDGTHEIALCRQLVPGYGPSSNNNQLTSKQVTKIIRNY